MSHDEMVGRTEELGRFGRDLDGLRAGRGAVLAYTGEPGIGKTRLMAAFAGAARAAALATREAATVAGALTAVRRTPGLVVFVDDLHRAPAGSAALLGELAGLAGARPALLVLAYRPRQIDPAIGAVLGRAEASAALRRITLGPLGPADARDLLPGHPEAERVHAEGGGNPLYMRLLADPAAELAGGPVGEVAGLGAAALDVARTAAVLGGRFTMDLLIQACTHDPGTTILAVEALVAADVLRPDEARPELAFRHPVLADAVYRHTAIGDRWVLHRRVDEVLARRGAAPPHRARHIAATGLTVPEHAEVLLAAAAACLDTDPASARRWAGAAGALMPHDDPRRFEAEGLAARSGLLLGDVTTTRDTLLARWAHGGGRAVDAVYAGRALTLLGRYDEAGALLRDGRPGAPGDPGAPALLTDLANLHSEDLDFASATRHATTAAGLAREQGDRLREAAALAERAWALGGAGDIAAARAAAGAAAALVDAMSDAALARDLRCLHQLGLAETLLEEVIDADRHLTRGVDLCRRTGQGHLLAALLSALGEVHLLLGRIVPAMRILDEAVFQAGRDDLVPQQSRAAGIRGIARYWLDDDDEAVLADAAAIEARCAGLSWAWAVLNRCLAGELTIMAGDPKRGSRMLLSLGGGPELPRLAARRRVRTWESLAVAALASGDRPAAERYTRLAAGHSTTASSASRRAIARRAAIRTRDGSAEELAVAVRSAVTDFAGVHHRLDQAHTELAAGRAFLDAGHPDLAAEQLDRAADHAAAFGSGRLARLVAVAGARLDRTAVPSWAHPLTNRELEVAELAGSGLTSAQIGRRLFLSVRTVDSHLGRVYRKLGVPSRTALAQLVVRSSMP
ncbi:LuxR C-terminal-related transcriptional regulator [Actinoplanes sp. CA-054009]